MSKWVQMCSTESGEGHLQALNIAVQSAAVMDGFLRAPRGQFQDCRYASQSRTVIMVYSLIKYQLQRKWELPNIEKSPRGSEAHFHFQSEKDEWERKREREG